MSCHYSLQLNPQKIRKIKHLILTGDNELLTQFGGRGILVLKREVMICQIFFLSNKENIFCFLFLDLKQQTGKCLGLNYLHLKNKHVFQAFQVCYQHTCKENGKSCSIQFQIDMTNRQHLPRTSIMQVYEMFPHQYNDKIGILL